MISDNGQRAMIANYDDFAIVWELRPNDWARGPYSFKVPDMLPYFIDGEDYGKLHNQQDIGLMPYALLCGILLSWNESESFWKNGHYETPHRFLVSVLENLRQDAGFFSMEEMILKVAGSLRDAHDPLLSSQLLMSGWSILPDSIRISCNLILDLWMVLEQTDEVDRESTLKVIVRAYQESDIDNVNTHVFQVLDYIFLVSLSFLGRGEERDALFWQTVPRWNYYPALKDLMFKLTKDDNPNFHAYRMWNRKEFYH